MTHWIFSLQKALILVDIIALLWIAYAGAWVYPRRRNYSVKQLSSIGLTCATLYRLLLVLSVVSLIITVYRYI